MTWYLNSINATWYDVTAARYASRLVPTPAGDDGVTWEAHDANSKHDEPTS